MSMKINDNSDAIIKNIETNTKSFPVGFRASTKNSLERNPVEDSFNKENQNKKKGLIAALGSIGVVVLTLGLICYSKGKSLDGIEKKFSQRMKDGWNDLWNITKKNIDDLDGQQSSVKHDAEEKARLAAEKAAKEAEEKAAKEAEEKAAREAEEKARIEIERQLRQERFEIMNIGDRLNIYFKIKDVDEETIKLIRKDLIENQKIDVANFLPANIEDCWFYVSNLLIKNAKDITDPLEKEILLKKAAKYLPNSKKYLEKDLAYKCLDIHKEIKSLHSMKDVDFKHRDLGEELLAKANELIKQDRDYQKAVTHIHFDVDADLYRKLSEKSKSYNNHGITDPLGWEYHHAGRISLFLKDTIPQLIKEETDLLAKESLYLKQLKIDPDGSTNQVKYIIKMKEFYNNIDDARNVGFKHLESFNNDFDELINKYIFKKFKFKNEYTETEKLDIFKTFVSRKNWLSDLEKVEPKEIANILDNLTRLSGNLKYYDEAVHVLSNNNSKAEANKYIDRFLNETANSEHAGDKELAETFRKLKSENENALKNLKDSIKNLYSKRNHSKTVDKVIKSSKFVETSLNNVAKQTNRSYAEVVNSIKSGDYNTIYRLVNDIINTTECQPPMFLAEAKNIEAWDDILKLLKNIDDSIINPVELEKIKNIKARALGAKSLQYKYLNPDVSNIYNEMLKNEIREIIIGRNNNNLTEEISDNVLNKLTSHIKDFVYTPRTERTLYYSIENCLGDPFLKEKEISFLKDLKSRIENRYNFKNWSEEDFFKDFYNRFHNKTKTQTYNKTSAIEVLNKYAKDLDLTLNENSNANEIKQVYRKLALKYHPDTVRSPEQAKEYEEIFKEICEAYSSLKN